MGKAIDQSHSSTGLQSYLVQNTFANNKISKIRPQNDIKNPTTGNITRLRHSRTLFRSGYFLCRFFFSVLFCFVFLVISGARELIKLKHFRREIRNEKTHPPAAGRVPPEQLTLQKHHSIRLRRKTNNRRCSSGRDAPNLPASMFLISRSHA